MFDSEIIFYFVVAVTVLTLIVVFTRLIYVSLRDKLGNGFSSAFVIAVFLAVMYMLVVPAMSCGCGGEKPRQTSCASNMKQLGLGLIQYVQDYDGKFPGGAEHWAGAIYSYEKSTGVYHCPDDKTQNTEAPAYACSYAMNANMRGVDQQGLSLPSASVLATEIDGTPVSNFPFVDRTSEYTTGVLPNSAWGGIQMGTDDNFATPPRHNPSVMCLECDGHVKLLRPSKVSSGADNPSASAGQDATHAAGTNALASTGSQYTLTFSKR